jgi:hypothetical protein
MPSPRSGTSKTVVVNKRSLYSFPGVDKVVYIGRPSKFGNPFIIPRDGTRAQVILKYRKWLVGQLQKSKSRRIALEALRGKVLVCWCKPLACHGDVIVELLEERRWA